jgi:predicted CoA-substrate-specific enzyme activase
MHSIGFDLGSVAIKAVLLGPKGEIERVHDQRRDRDEANALLAFLDTVDPRLGGEGLALGITGGVADDALAEHLTWTNSLLAVAAGIRALHPEVRSILEIGGHTAKYLVIGENGSLKDFATNEACAAGTGAFLEQQARRLGLSVQELAILAAQAERGATIAGRCSVFANSDMIHLQQKGTPLPEIAYGLCVAIARNFLTTLLKGRGAAPPVLLAGGCARNPGILRAFREVLGLEGPALQASAHAGLEGAIGAALLARHGETPGISMERLRGLVPRMLAGTRGTRAALPILPRIADRLRPEEPTGGSRQDAEGYLGLDVGSVSTDLVLLDGAGELLTSVYLPTQGRPSEVLMEGLAALKARYGGGLRILGCGATGSGRHLAAKLAGADVVKNEITCQLLGAQRYVPEVDTILEIGGQDSKFIRARNGALADFAMNKVCAAGTGSFLEEQSLALGVAIRDDFAARAFASGPPPDLGSRCTVFMETEVVGAMAGGIPVADICAGLAYSIARNYLDKVVGPRSIGQHIVFQGGVASNGAVVAAFREILQRPIQVHPFNRISGAIGAALAARTAMGKAGRPSLFKGFLQAQAPALHSFECHQCSNRCDVNVIETGGERAFFGDTCERYTSGALAKSCRVPNLAEAFVAQCESMFGSAADPGPRIGIPRSSSLAGSQPFWAIFWKELGFCPVLSEPSSQETLALGLTHLSVGVCLPIKLTAGHVHSLLAKGIEPVFLPSVVLFPGEDAAHSYACPYTMAAPYMVDLLAHGKGLSPVIRFESEDLFIEGFEPFLKALHVSREQVSLAWRAATWGQAEVEGIFRQRARALIKEGAYRHVFGILGRPYGLFDSYANLGLFERLRRMDILAVPLPFIPTAKAEKSAEATLPWRYPADMQRTAAGLAEDPGIHPIVLSSFACGPDAFALGQIGRALQDRAHLILEFDEHRGEAGLITRLEAFLDQLEGVSSRASRHGTEPLPSTAFIPSAPSRVRIPFFSDCAYAFSGLFQFMGHEARVLPRPDGASRALGEQHSLGKECHAYTMIAGDLLHMAASAPAEGTVFFFPGTSLPCLLHEYGPAMQAMLGELGIKGIQVSSPDGEQLLSTFGFRAIERFYLGLVAIEILMKAVCQVRPYERTEGSTDRVHQQNLERIEAAIAGGAILDALKQSLECLGEVPLVPERNRPVVGIAGDIYTRVNPIANQDLVHWMEAQGLEVWPSPFQIDLLDFGISQQFHHSLASRDLAGTLLYGPVALWRALHQWRVRNVVGARLARGEEPDYEKVKRLAAPYMPNEAHELLFLNIAKIADFAKGGADGIINAICFGCMVGNASAAVIERIRKDYDDIPIMTAVYANGEDPSRRMMLEAFVSQVKARHRAPGHP